MTMPDPTGLREFRYEVAELSPGQEWLYAYRITQSMGERVEFRSEWEPLQATTREAASAEASTRTMLVAAMVQGATVESLAPRGIGDDGQHTTTWGGTQ